MLYTERGEANKEVTNQWWLFLLGAVAWFIVSLLVLRMNLTSGISVGVLLGILFVATGFVEFLVGSVRTRRAGGQALLVGFYERFRGASYEALALQVRAAS